MNGNPLISPPRWADRFLEWYCHEDLIDEIQGDLHEKFNKNLEAKGYALARRKFVIDVFRFFRPSSFKRTKIQMNFHIISNYLKVAFRVFKKEKSYTLTNVLGLTLGITASLMIYLWVQDELKYNQWPEEVERIHYVLVNQAESSGKIYTWRTTPQPLREVLEQKYPAIEKAAITNWGATLILKKESDNLELKGHYGSAELFDIFSIPFVRGNHQLLYDQPESIVLSAKAASGYFGEDWQDMDVIGKAITDKYGRQFTLAGVFENIPSRSTVHFDFIIPFEYMLRTQPSQKRWGNYNHNMYVQIADGYTTETANQNVVNAIRENREDVTENAPILLQPFESLYLHSKYENGKLAGGRIDYVILLSISAILILVLAAVNFMNLTTARSAKRSKETGIRKVMGAFRRSLRLQFILEAILIVSFAAILSGFAVAVLLPYFNILTGKEISLTFFTPQFILLVMGFVVLIGVLSGLYPAFYMAAVNPILSMKGILKADRSHFVFRRGLIVFQFVITITMIVGSVTIYKQLQYVFNKNLGLDKENVIMLSIGDMNLQTLNTYREKLHSMPGIQGIALSDGNPTSVGSSTSDPSWQGKDPETEIYFKVLGVGHNFINMMNIPLIAGRNFDPEIASDSTNYLINEETAKMLAFEDPVGQSLEFWGNKGKIIGVVKNFHISSLHTPINPLIMRLDPESWMILVKTKPGMHREAIASLETLHHEFNPDRKFDFDFLDREFVSRYKSEKLVSKLTLYFTLIAIVISCLGLLSLVAFNTELRSKEIGIRKVLGASVPNILVLISKEFLILISIAFAVATPLSFYVMQNWLNQFAFRINLDFQLYLLAAIGALIITLITIGNHAIRTATRNPVESLRDE